MTRKLVVGWFVLELVFSLGLLVHVCLTRPENVWTDAAAATVILGVAAVAAVLRRMFQCWQALRGRGDDE